jgi:hypothetical protein
MRYKKLVLMAAIVLSGITAVCFLKLSPQTVSARPTAVEIQPAFGIFGVSHGETVRLNIANLTVRSDGEIPPGPCRALLTFRDGDGRPFTNSVGQPVRSEITVRPGESAFLDLNADQFIGNSTNGFGRLQLRPFVHVLSAPPVPDLPPPCFPSAEVFDNTPGRTSFYTGPTFGDLR